jgi:hypothetical protein
MTTEEFRKTLDENIMYKVDSPNYMYALPKDMSQADLLKLAAAVQMRGKAAILEESIRYSGLILD